MTTSRALTAPMRAMNRPMPTLIARRRSSGIALITASRTPASTSTSTSETVQHDQPHGRLPRAGLPRDLKRDDGVQPHAGCERDAESSRPGPSAACRCAAAAAVAASGRLERDAGGCEDRRVREQDVRHRQERGDAAADLARHRGTTSWRSKCIWRGRAVYPNGCATAKLPLNASTPKCLSSGSLSHLHAGDATCGEMRHRRADAGRAISGSPHDVEQSWNRRRSAEPPTVSRAGAAAALFDLTPRASRIARAVSGATRFLNDTAHAQFRRHLSRSTASAWELRGRASEHSPA